MATKKEKEIIIKTRKPGLPVNIKKPSIPQSSNAMGASGTVLNNVNVRPTRWQTAKHDAKVIYKDTKTLGDLVSKGKTKAGKAVKKGLNAIGGAIGTAVSVTGGLPMVGFNVASGQARYNQNKRAGLERGEQGFKVRNSSTPLAETEFND